MGRRIGRAKACALVIATGMPDVAPGATPIAFGNWKQAYMVINRRGVTVMNDPFSAGWCNLFRFDARVGGSVVCPNAARLLRIR
jgi:HK97 family phage major capsid protein